jgi:opacity protein-like surface antigen
MKKASYSLAIPWLVFLLFITPANSASAQVGPLGGHVGFWGGFTVAPDASSGDYDDGWYYHDYDLDMKETWAAGVKFGYTPPPWKYFSFEFEYSYLNPDIKRSVLERYGSDYLAVEGDVRIHNFMWNLFLKYPLGWFHPYLGAGLGFSYSDMSAIATQRIGSDVTTAPVGDDYTSFAYQFLTGVEFDVTKNLVFDIGYRYYATGLKLKNNDLDIYLDDSVDIDFTTSMITMGFKVLF